MVVAFCSTSRSRILLRFAARCSFSSYFIELAVALHLADIVHQAVEQPLRVDLAFAAQAEALEPVHAAHVGETGSTVPRRRPY